MNVGTDRPLPEDLADEIRDCIPVAEQILGVDRDELTPEEVHRKMFDWMYARWKAAGPLSEDEYDEFIVPLACLWGQMICEELGWNWAWVEVKRNEGAAIISPDRSRVVYPLSSFQDSLTQRGSVPTCMALYRMFRDRWGPQPGPGAYAVFG